MLIFSDAEAYLDQLIHRDAQEGNSRDLQLRYCALAVKHWVKFTMESLDRLEMFSKHIEDSLRVHKAIMPSCTGDINQWGMPCCNILDEAVDFITDSITDVKAESFSSVLTE